MAYDEESPDKLSEDEKKLVEIQARYEAARDHASKWRKEAKTCFAMYANDQWSQDDIAKMVEQQRTPVTFNRAAILIDAVIGYEVNNRQETRFIGRTQGDAKVNEQLTEAARYFRDQCDAEFEESDAFRDMAICGMGWTNDRLSDQYNPDYDLVRDRVDPFEMLWDPSCKKPCLADKRYVFRKKWMDKQEAKAIFPDWDGIYSPAEWLNDDDPDTEEKAKNPRNAYKGENDEMSPMRDIPVLEYQYVDSETKHTIVHPATQETMEFTDEQWESISEELKAKIGANHKAVKENVWKRCFLIGAEIIKKDQPFPKGCTYDCVTGKRDRNKGYWFGLMRSLHDTQMWSNKFLAQIMHLINTTAKPGYDMEEGAVKDQAKFEANAAKPGALNVFTDQALQKQRVQRREAAPLPPDLANLLEYANKSMSDVSGVNQELLGMADREQPGVLEYQRKQSAVTLLAPLFDSFRRYRKMSARTWLYFMQTYMTDGRLIRITVDANKQQPQDQMMQGQPMQPGMPQQQMMGQMGQSPMQGRVEQNVPFTKEFFDPNVAEYDVIIDQGASSPNLKEATWAAIQPMLPLMAERMGPDEVALVLEYSPMPESFMEKYRAIHAQKAQQGPPPDPDMEKAKAQIAIKQEDAAIEKQKGEQEMKFAREEHELKMQQMRDERAFEMQTRREDIEHSRREAEQKFIANGMMSDQALQNKRDMAQASLIAKLAGKSTKGIDRDADAAEAKALGDGLAQLGQAIAELAKQVANSQQQTIAAILAPKTVKKNGDGSYTTQSVMVN